MATVEEILLKKGSNVIAVVPETTVSDAAIRMKEANVGCVVVEQQPNTIIGIVTERDFLRRVLAEKLNPDQTTVKDIMTAPVLTCHPRDELSACAAMLEQHHIRHVLVVDRDEPVGMISQRDVLAAILS
jgi:CBS domain-containing protein